VQAAPFPSNLGIVFEQSRRQADAGAAMAFPSRKAGMTGTPKEHFALALDPGNRTLAGQRRLRSPEGAQSVMPRAIRAGALGMSFYISY
jgi:hypothetical protein